MTDPVGLLARLVAVFALLAVVLWLLKRTGGLQRRGTPLQVLSTTRLGKSATLSVVRVHGEEYVLGVSGSGVTVVTSRPADEPEAGTAPAAARATSARATSAPATSAPATARPAGAPPTATPPTATPPTATPPTAAPPTAAEFLRRRERCRPRCTRPRARPRSARRRAEGRSLSGAWLVSWSENSGR